MVIDYPITGPWVKGITPPDDPNDFLFGFFMPIIDKKFKSNLPVPEFAEMEFGEYLRRCEASDHMRWVDPAKMQLVSRIQKNAVKIINEKASGISQKKVEATASKLANKLGKKLLPRIGYGKKQIGGGSSGGTGSGGARIINSQLDITGQRMFGNRMEMDFILTFMHSKKSADISLLIAAEGGNWITPKSWKDDIGTEFPVEINKVEIDTITYSSDVVEKNVDITCKKDSERIDIEEMSLCLTKSEGSKEYSGISIASNVYNLRIKGVITVFAMDKKYQFSFRID